MRQNYSRLNRIQEYQNKKTAVVFGGLTLFIIIFGFFFGIPLISKFVGLFSKPAKTQTVSNSVAIAPTLSTLPQFTNQSSLIVKGNTSANSKVKIFVNNDENDVQSDSDGNFTSNITLTKGDNTIFAQTVNGSATSNDSTHVVVNYDNEIPDLTVNSPSDGQSFFGDKQRSINVTGQTGAENTLTVNDRVAILDSSGKFNLNYDLSDGDNQLKIIATDRAGNKKEIDLKVTFSSS